MKSKISDISWLGLALVATIQWLIFYHSHDQLPLFLQTLLPGLAIFGAAFLLSWAAEVAQLDIPQALAVAFVALVAVLPEYAVDLYFAWIAGKDPSYTQFATANMTGANRLLIGVGWATVLLAFWIRSGQKAIILPKSNRTELLVLLVATVYSFIIPLKGTLSLWDAAILLVFFFWYLRKAKNAELIKPEIEGGVAEILSQLSPWRRRLAAGFLFILASVTIFISAEPFAEGLLALGATCGIEQFILVQWLAPLASESPEFLVAILFALRLKPEVGLATLVSSKVNQWTLLIASLPVAYCISSGKIHPMVLDARQVEEVFLTAAQSLLAVLILLDLKFSAKEALLLLVLFATQLLFSSTTVRYGYGVGYLILSAVVLILRKGAGKNFRSLLDTNGHL